MLFCFFLRESVVVLYLSPYPNDPSPITPVLIIKYIFREQQVIKKKNFAGKNSIASPARIFQCTMRLKIVFH